MKRDIDLFRQLLLDIERHGAECSPDALRNGDGQEERVRYHVRLLVDAGLAKETNRTSAGQPCVRLTNAGHEFLDLCRSEARWREAKWVVKEQTGGLSLAVLRAVLTKWAVEGITRGERQRRWRGIYRPFYERDYYRGEPVYRVDSYRYEREPVFDEEPVRVVRQRRDYREPVAPEAGWSREPFVEEPIADEPLSVSLPVSMI